MWFPKAVEVRGGEMQDSMWRETFAGGELARGLLLSSTDMYIWEETTNG